MLSTRIRSGLGAAAIGVAVLATLGESRYNVLVHPSKCPLVNVGSGVDQTIRELAEIIATAVGYKGKFVQDTSRPDGTMRKVLDVTRMKELGWKSSISLKEGIKLTYQKFVEAHP